MTRLTEEQKTEYFRRSYTAVDGLWFMKVEEKLGFDEALRLDESVWKVLPKIQARTLKGMMHLQRGLPGLEQALSARLTLEGFDYEMEPREDGFAVIVKRCPWHDIMVKSGRGELSERVSELICKAENSVWASEFSGEKGMPIEGEVREGEGREIEFQREERICRGEERCVLRFCIVEGRAPGGRAWPCICCTPRPLMPWPSTIRAWVRSWWKRTAKSGPWARWWM